MLKLQTVNYVFLAGLNLSEFAISDMLAYNKFTIYIIHANSLWHEHSYDQTKYIHVVPVYTRVLESARIIAWRPWFNSRRPVQWISHVKLLSDLLMG